MSTKKPIKLAESIDKPIKLVYNIDNAKILMTNNAVTACHEVIVGRTGIYGGNAMNHNPANTKERNIECQTFGVMKPCPQCGKRLFDKITPTTGTIKLKCPNCHKIVEVNLAFRMGPPLRSYRR